MAPSVGWCVGVGLGHSEMRVMLSTGGKPEVVGAESGLRSTPAMVAVSANGEWLVGDAAEAQAGKNSKATLTDVLSFLPRENDDNDGDALRERLALTNQKVDVLSGKSLSSRRSASSLNDESGKKQKGGKRKPQHQPETEEETDGTPGVVLQPTGSTETWTLTADNAVTKLFSKLKKLADDAAGGETDDYAAAVLSVPMEIYESPRAGACLRTGAKAAKIEVLQIIADPYAAALAYDLDDDDDDGLVDTTTRVAIVDVGGTSASCAVLERGGGGVFREPPLRYVSRRDASCGAMTAKLEAFCAIQFHRQHRIDVNDGGERAKRKLRSACVQAAKILTTQATTQADVEADALVDGIDCRIKVTKARFDDMCVDVLKNLDSLVKESLAEDSSSETVIVLCGGGGKAPAVRAVAERWSSSIFPEKNNGRRHFFDPDEAVPYGAAIQASLMVFGADPIVDEPATKQKKGRRVVAPRLDALNALGPTLPHTQNPVFGCLVVAGRTDDDLPALVRSATSRLLLCPRFAALPFSAEADLPLESQGTLFVAFSDADHLLAACDVTTLLVHGGALHLAIDIDVQATLTLALSPHKNNGGGSGDPVDDPLVLVCPPAAP